MNSINKQPMPLQSEHLETKQLLAAKLLSFMLTLHKLPPKLFRYLFLMMDRMLGLKKIAMYQVVDVNIPVSTYNSGATTIKIRAYYPTENHSTENQPSANQPKENHSAENQSSANQPKENQSTAKKPHKTLVYFHGGGCVIGSINTHDRFCRYLAKHGNMNIISVDYRLSPEYKFPTPICDAIDAWNYINDNSEKLNINPQHIAVGGDSAGAYLACLIGLNSLQTELPVQAKVKPIFQFLIYPMLDLEGTTASYRSFNKHLILTRDLMDYFRRNYLNSLDEVTLPLVSPLKTSDVSGSPESYILTLGYDPLRDDGIAYVERLKTAGIKTHHEHYEDCMHGFISVTRLSVRAKQATHNMAVALNRFNGFNG
jgi:acetyl esterase